MDKTPFAKSFARFLRENGIKTFYALSRKTGMNTETCRKMFSPKYTGPNWPTIKILAGAFGYDAGEFVSMMERKYKRIR